MIVALAAAIRQFHEPSKISQRRRHEWINFTKYLNSNFNTFLWRHCRKVQNPRRTTPAKLLCNEICVLTTSRRGVFGLENKFVNLRRLNCLKNSSRSRFSSLETSTPSILFLTPRAKLRWISYLCVGKYFMKLGVAGKHLSITNWFINWGWRDLHQKNTWPHLP